jgi:NADPH:quinone reductase-like Zn-dependent oxidoreductase
MEERMMRAWVIDQLGGPEVYRVGEVPVPEPLEGEVQVRVEGAGMNPVDWKIRSGLFTAAAPKIFPAVTLREFAGTVSKQGPGVTEWKVGDTVYGITDVGAAAEYTVAKSESIGPSPFTLAAWEAALVPLAGMTAWQALFDHGGLRAGQRVLIHAAAGGVGTFAVQLAKWKGAYVIGTASKRNHPLLRTLGADEMIDYHDQRFDEVVRNVDVVLHSIGQEDLAGSLKVLKPGGILVAISAQPDVQQAMKEGKRAVWFMMQPSTENLAQLATLIDTGKIRPVVDSVVPLSEGPKTMAEVEQGHEVGKNGVRLF